MGDYPNLLIYVMVRTTSTTYLPGPEPTLELIHSLLEKHDAWNLPFHAFQDLISERVEGNQTFITRWDIVKLTASWETVQYLRRHYILKANKGVSDT